MRQHSPFIKYTIHYRVLLASLSYWSIILTGQNMGNPLEVSSRKWLVRALTASVVLTSSPFLVFSMIDFALDGQVKQMDGQIMHLDAIGRHTKAIDGHVHSHVHSGQ
ncbi:hypothetical protein F4818DRAFT_419674 [Hypoxylon cercidicola]|nr:hypothetical protein F4818DRAFT_419674 [Hypoxylon cercidicola]